jgi:hypothetical protein
LGFGNAVKIVDFGGFMGILECVFLLENSKGNPAAQKILLI